ncbi:metal tolerance protein 4-like, partial [Trifolium medium]|nr:metal tolerance protein 4-like [Trifolium medium]
RRNRVTRRNSVNSLRSAFLSTLPDKVRSNLDSESPFDVDLSKATALSQGPLSLKIYRSRTLTRQHRQ